MSFTFKCPICGSSKYCECELGEKKGVLGQIIPKPGINYIETKCPDCGETMIQTGFGSINNCTCKKNYLHLGKITPVKAYQTTDGRKFVGESAREDAEDHQRWLDNQPKPEPPKPSKPPLKKLKRRKRGPRKDRN